MRLATLILTACLLSGCSSKPADPLPGLPEIPQNAPAVAVLNEPMTERFQLSGALLTPPAGSVVELALLLVDQKGRPKDLLGSTTLNGTGQPLPFSLGFSSDQLPAGLSAQLRVRVSQSGQLTQRLPGKSIMRLQSQSLGDLKLVDAP